MKPNKKPRSELSVRQALVGYLFAAPALALYFTLVLAPVIVTIILSFSYYDYLGGVRWVGLENYVRLFNDTRFYHILGNTFIFTIFAVSFNVGVGLVLALALNRAMPSFLLYFFRLAFFLPVIIAGSFVAIVWSYLLGDQLGIVNYYLNILGFDMVRWLTSSRNAMMSVIIVDVWKNTGFFMIIFVAALQGIPRTVMDAATMDGASAWRRFYKITLPFISPVVFFNVVLASIGALQVYETIYILTEGGPGDATRSVTIYVVDQAFNAFEFGYGASVSVVLMVLILIVTAVQFAASKRLVS